MSAANWTRGEENGVRIGVFDGKKHIAHVCRGIMIPKEEAEANFALIAAAPEMLVSLESLARYADEVELILRGTHPAKSQSLRQWVMKAIAVIAKATWSQS